MSISSELITFPVELEQQAIEWCQNNLPADEWGVVEEDFVDLAIIGVVTQEQARMLSEFIATLVE